MTIQTRTGAQRYNDKMDKIFEQARISKDKWNKIRLEEVEKLLKDNGFDHMEKNIFRRQNIDIKIIQHKD